MSTTKKLGKVTRTSRGFEIIKFRDRYASPSSLQMSSLAEHEQPGVSAVWLGLDGADPQFLHCDAEKLGIKIKKTSGWISYPIPKEVALSTRMHLDRKQVAALIGHLSRWLETGSLK